MLSDAGRICSATEHCVNTTQAFIQTDTVTEEYDLSNGIKSNRLEGRHRGLLCPAIRGFLE